jgi:hypothetical protein
MSNVRPHMPYQDEHALETFKSLITVSVEGLKTLLLINGGAIVALLAFIGQSAQGPEFATRLSLPVALFVLGVVFGTLAFGASYRTQYALLNEQFPARQYRGWRHQAWLKIAFGLSALSVLSFAVGALWAIAAFAGQSAPSKALATPAPHTAASTASAQVTSPGPPASRASR